MQGSLGQPPIVIRSSRKSTALLLLIPVTFVAIGLMMAKDPEESAVTAYFIAGFFALCIPPFIWRLVRPDTLTLTPEEIVWQGVFVTNRWRWDEVQDFRAYRPTYKTVQLSVGFDFTGRNEGGSLGSGWELGAPEVADLLNRARGLWLRSRKTEQFR